MRYSEKRRLEILDDYKKSGLSKKEFALLRGIPYRTFHWLIVRGTSQSISGYHIPVDKREIRPPLSDDKKELIFGLYQAHKSMSYISKKLDIPYYQVRYFLKGPSGTTIYSAEKRYKSNKKYYERRKVFCLEERARINYKKAPSD